MEKLCDKKKTRANFPNEILTGRENARVSTEKSVINHLDAA